MFISELGLALARLVSIADDVMIGEQQARPDEKSRTVPGAAIAWNLDPADRVSCASAAVKEIDRHQVAIANDALESIGIAARRLEQLLANGEPLIRSRP